MKKLFIIAGEASGDRIGAALIKKYYAQGYEITGIGGPLMEEAGHFKSLFPMTDLSVMGIAEILPKLLLLLGRIDETKKALARFKPDIVLTIDSPDFSFRIQKVVKDTQKIHVVAPTVWAWRAGRAKKISKFLDELWCLFPFEPPYFEKHGLKTLYIGHPLTWEALPVKEMNVKPQRLGIFLGSRDGEIQRHADFFMKSIRSMNDVEFIFPTLPHLHEKIEKKVLEYLHPGTFTVVSDPQTKWADFLYCDVAIAVSGTVGLELAYLGVPHIIAYKMNWFTAMLVRLLVRVKFAHLANIILGKQVVPEFIQENATPENIKAAIGDLMSENSLSAINQAADFEALRSVLAPRLSSAT
ncbi:MAG: lipid-A-disaccharide synthase [Alphaproteobacteria bacterium]|nr:lipid-A-disaccharide synthase [Alphaproteobacteria bacterium]